MAIVLLAMTPVAYSVTHLLDETFRDAFLGNLAATVIGVVVGIPIALELNRREVAAEQERSAAAQREEALHRYYQPDRLPGRNRHGWAGA